MHLRGHTILFAISDQPRTIMAHEPMAQNAINKPAIIAAATVSL
jgi:hypothetical protein